jgi:hypothetical protein
MENNKFASRVNKDLIREMFHFGHWTPSTEKFVIDHEYATVRYLLSKGRDVIVDDTNLNEDHLTKYQEIANAHGATVNVITFDTPIEECIARDAERQAKGERYVGRDNIINMAHKFGVLRQEKDCVIFDLDGTLCNLDQLRHLVRPEDFPEATDKVDGVPKPNWDKFFEESINDLPRKDIIQKMHDAKAAGQDVIIVSACPEDYRELRTAWLKKHGAIWDRFIMRRHRDYRQDDIVKQEILDNYLDSS